MLAQFPLLRRAMFLTVLSCLAAAGKPSPARADWQMLPKPEWQLLRTYALLIDQQTSVLYYGTSHVLGSIGASFALAGNPDPDAHPQIVVQASATAAMRFDPNGRIYSETIDARAGLSYDFAIDSELRASLGFIHHSGHAADGVLDADLLTVNLGDDILVGRLVKDWGNRVRTGFTLRPYYRSGPPMQFFASDEFVEWFPWGGKDSNREPSPYLSFSLEHDGVTDQSISTSYNAQVGVSLGNHFSTEHSPSVRAVLGYYNGVDYRLKYFQYRLATMAIGYTGLMVEL